MKKKYIKGFSQLALLGLLSLSMVSCNQENSSTIEKTPSILDNEFIINNDSLKLKGESTADDIFYEIFVGAFSDSNGDGIGDLRGLINRLDYLNDGDPNSGKSLGVTGLWLMPVFKSSSYHKYDITDYYEVDPSYGTNDDLKELFTEAHKRGIKVILDMPINHTSTSNQWFLDFKSALKNNDFSNQFADYYVYVDNKSDLTGRKTTALAGTNYKYESNFDSSMPELNFDNYVVREEVVNIAKYWIDNGCDGYRFDAAKYIYYESTEKSVDFWKWYMSELKEYKNDVYCVAEVWDSPVIIEKYYEAFTCFDFAFSQAEGYVAKAVKDGSAVSYISSLITYLNKCKAINPNVPIAPFIDNHDLDRQAGYLPIADGSAYNAANLILLAPGTPFIYYGSEIGMRGSRGSANTDANRRLAMLWGDEDTVKNPVGSTYDSKYQINGTLSSQISVENSLYNHYKKLIMMRKANPELTNGSLTQIKLGLSNSVGAYKATKGDSSCVVLYNVSNQEYNVSLDKLEGYNIINSYAGVGSVSIEGGSIKLGANTVVILRK